MAGKFDLMQFLGKSMTGAGNALAQRMPQGGQMQQGMMDEPQMNAGQQLGTGIGRMISSFMDKRNKKKREQQQGIIV